MRMRNVMLGLAAGTMTIGSGVANAASPPSVRAAESSASASQLQDDEGRNWNLIVVLGIVLAVIIGAAVVSFSDSESP